jgi:hypothetical protein
LQNSCKFLLVLVLFISISLSTALPSTSTDRVQPLYQALTIHENNSQSVHEVVCGTLKQYEFLVCTANDLPLKVPSKTSIAIPDSGLDITSDNTMTNLTSANRSSEPSNVGSNLPSIESKPDSSTVESTRLILNDAIQDIKNDDNEKALLYLDLVKRQIMAMTRDNATTLSSSVTVLTEDAIERLQNGDSDAALLYLDLINKQMPRQISDNQTRLSTNTTAIDAVSLNHTAKSTNQSAGTSIEPKSSANNTIKDSTDKKTTPVQELPIVHTYNLTNGNMTFPIKYTINNATVNNITLNREQASMIMNLSTTDNGILNIDLPRAIIDSKDDKNLDEDYLVLTDGLLADYIQDSSNNQFRKISIDFENGVEEIEIQGTETFGVKPIVKPTVIPPPPIPQELMLTPEEISNEISSQINMSSLETYSNYACGIDMQYPSDWTELEPTEEDRDGGAVVYFTPDGNADLSLRMIDVPSTRTLRGLTIQTIDNLEQIEPDFTLLESNSTYVGTHPSHQIIYTSTSETDTELYKSLVIWTIEDDRAYYFRFDSNDISTFESYLPYVYNVINSTQISTPGEDISDDYTITC